MWPYLSDNPLFMKGAGSSIAFQRRRKWHSFTGNKRQAQSGSARLFAQLEGGLYLEPSKTTVAHYQGNGLAMSARESRRNARAVRRAGSETDRTKIGRRGPHQSDAAQIATASADAIESAEQTAAGVRYKSPKPGRSRTVALSATVVEELASGRRKLLRLGVRTSDTTFVYTKEDGEPVPPRSLSQAGDR